MSVFNEANVSSDPSVPGGAAAFNYLDGGTKPTEDKKTACQDVQSLAPAVVDDRASYRDHGDAPVNQGEAISSAPAVTEMYRGPERGFQPPRDYRSPERRGLARGHERNGEIGVESQKRTIQSQPDLGRQTCQQQSLDKSLPPSYIDFITDLGCEEAPSEGRETDVPSASDVNVSIGRSELGGSSAHGSSAHVSSPVSSAHVSSPHASSSSTVRRSNVVLVASKPSSSVHKLSRRSERRLRKHQGCDEEEEELANILNDIYRRSCHNDAHRTMVALRSSQSTSDAVQWVEDRHDHMAKGAEYHKTAPPKKTRTINVDANLNNNAVSSVGRERVTPNQVMDTLRRQPLKLAEKERFRSAVLSHTNNSKSSKDGNFDRRGHKGTRRRILSDRRQREPRGSGGFFVSLIKEFGQPITSYFDFLRWLILVNLLLSALVIIFLVAPRYLPSGQTHQTAATTRISSPPLDVTQNVSSPGSELQSVVAALFSGSKFMTEYPTPIFFSFFGYDDGVARNDVDAEIVKEKSIEGEKKKTEVPREEGNGNITAEEEMVSGLLDGSSHGAVNILGMTFYYDFPLAYALTVHVCVYIFIVLVLAKMAPFAMESMSAKLERVDRGFAFMIFATFDHGATDETTVIMNQISMTDELLTKLDAAESSTNRGARRRVRSCCDVVIRIVVGIHLLALALLVAWALEMTLLETPTIFMDLLRASRETVDAKIPACLRCATAFFDDFKAPVVLFFGVKLLKCFSTMLVGVENYKPAKKGKINQGRMLVISIGLLFFYLYCLWKSTVDLCVRKSSSSGNMDHFGDKVHGIGCPLKQREVHITAGCSQNSPCWPVMIGQHFYRIWLLDFLWSVFVVLFIQFPRKILFSQLCLHRSCGRFSIQPFCISRRILDLINAQLICLLGLFYAPGLVILTAVKFIFVFYLMRLTVHCNCIPKGRLFQSLDAIVFSYALLCVAAVVSVLPFQLALMQGLPIKECGPFVATDSFSKLFHLGSVGPISASVVSRVETFLDSPLAPFLVFVFVLFGVIIVCVTVAFVVQRQKLYQLQHENDASRRDRAFLLQQYDTDAVAVASRTSMKTHE